MADSTPEPMPPASVHLAHSAAIAQALRGAREEAPRDVAAPLHQPDRPAARDSRRARERRKLVEEVEARVLRCIEPRLGRLEAEMRELRAQVANLALSKKERARG